MGDLNAQFEDWRTKIANPRVHSSTGLVVNEAFAAEQPFLLPLPREPYNAVLTVERRVSHVLRQNREPITGGFLLRQQPDNPVASVVDYCAGVLIGFSISADPFVQGRHVNPKSEDACSGVRPLVSAIRSASRLNSSVCCKAMVYLLLGHNMPLKKRNKSVTGPHLMSTERFDWPKRLYPWLWLRLSALLCICELVHASKLKEHDDNDDIKRTAGRTA